MQTFKKQQGSALIISLVILTAITLGAIVAMQRSTLQVRMVGSLQHQQKVFNAASSNLAGLLDELRTADQATTVLNDALQAQYNAANATIDPFKTEYGLVKPSLPTNIREVENKLLAYEPPSEHARSLKALEGSSAGVAVPLYFSSTATAIDSNNSLTSEQQMGFYYLAPSTAQ